MKYRISLRNGQVTPTYETYAETRRVFETLRHDYYAVDFEIQTFDGAEWIGIGKAGRFATTQCEGL